MNDIPIPTPLEKLARIFFDAGHVLYAVGGLPRNSLLGLPLSDMDICSAATPEAVLAICQEHGVHCVEKALKFGTLELHLEGAVFEHTTFRGAEEYAPGGVHRPLSVTLGATLTEDAFRRDFTVNALYYDILSGKLTDPTGGLKDLKAGVLRATSPDPMSILRDDGLRVLRLIRFAVELNLTVDPMTLAAAKACAPLLAGIAWERKREELIKILLSDARYPARYGINAFPHVFSGDRLPAIADLPPALPVNEASPVLRGLRLLESIGCLPYLLPELLEGQGIHQRPRHHAYTVLEHNFHCCACVLPTPLLRMTALLHDVGKPAALREKDLPDNAGATDNPATAHPMLGHDRIGAEMAADILSRLRFPAAFTDDAVFLIAHHMFDLNEMAKDGTLRMRFSHWGQQRVKQLIAVREADFVGSGVLPGHIANRWRQTLITMEQEHAPFSTAELALNGTDIMRIKAIPPGPEVGRLLDALLQHCARRPKDNTPERLEALLKGL